MNLYTDTPLASAIFELFEKFNEKLVIHLNEAQTHGAIKAFIFGGCAIHLFTNVRGSDDVDIEISSAKKLDTHSLILEVDDVYYTDPLEGDKVLSLDDTFNVGLPTLHPDYKERVIPLSTGNTVLHVYLVSAIDIAISKLERCQADDVTDIVALYKKGYFTLDEFEELAIEASGYSINPEKLRLNISHVIIECENS
ncbi:DUF6036 family nucleotidyltransferase [Paraglaciecola arctica]|uniref:DUF6036 family nucleotidyltransferase n=1 Tax=Paraglaciecola arctica TaxID=1128911 RepID=UPI001C07B880|nr:DUF6036 family nucleotidyltransferase [Paraglaciecola arctica]MBU3005938.1 hypothetical protein [Paraglaciecola arctica]